MPAPAILLLVMCLVAQPSAAESGSLASPVPPGIGKAECDQLKVRGVLSAPGPVGCEKLAIVRFSYIDFDGRTNSDGEIMVMAAAAGFVKTIFDTLHARRFPIARARLMDHYSGDDQASMHDNNTSAFNHRSVAGGKLPSLHAYGLAIDLNPVQNPYIRFRSDGRAEFSPPASIGYANRSNQRPGKTFRSGMAEQIVDLFAWNGFLVWGGDWDDPIDYQHFQVGRKMAERMAELTVEQARVLFTGHVQRYRACLKSKPENAAPAARIECVERLAE